VEIVDIEAGQPRQPSRQRGEVDRPRSADDFEAIHARMEELRHERERANLLEILQSYDTKRWVDRRKAAVVIAVREGVISRGIACDWYQLSSEELASWELAFKQSGTTGLRASYRFPEMPASAPPPVRFDRDHRLSDRLSSES
jgi:hypothetical protein